MSKLESLQKVELTETVTDEKAEVHVWDDGRHVLFSGAIRLAFRKAEVEKCSSFSAIKFLDGNDNFICSIHVPHEQAEVLQSALLH